VAETVFTFCRICEARCGLAVTVADDRVTRIAPDKENPHTWRDFCVKGRTACQVLEHPRRLRAPMKRVGDHYVEFPYDEAVGEIGAGLRRILDRHGADAIAFYTGNPWGFSGSNPTFVGGLMDGIGTRSRFSVGSIDHNAHMVVAEAMFGSPLMALVPDVDESCCFLFVGMNPAESAMNWVGSVPNGWRRVLDAQSKGADLIVVDPRRTLTAAAADTWIPVEPGQDWAFLLGVLQVVFERGWIHRQDCSEVDGVESLRALAASADLEDLARRASVRAEAIEDVARRFATASSAMCITRTGVSLNQNGTLGEWLGHALNVVTGRVDRPGGRRFEPGYVDSVKLYDTFVPPLEGRSRVRGLSPIAGAHTLATLPDEITTPGPGQVRALLIDCGNPVVSGPEGERLAEALRALELLVAVDLFQRESHRDAHWLIPGTHWLEREDLLLVTGSLEDEPFVQFGAQAVPPPPAVREEWQFFCDLALAMDVPLFDKRGVNTFVRATRAAARLSRRPGAAFNPRWLWRLLVLMGRKVSWRDIVSHPHGFVYGTKEYGKFREQLRSMGRRVDVAPDEFVAETRRLLRAPAPGRDPERPLRLVNRRRVSSMNSWLNEVSGTKGGVRGDELQVHPADAERLGVVHGQGVRVSSATATVEMTAEVCEEPAPGIVVAAHGWGAGCYDPKAPEERSVAPGINRNLLVSNEELDHFSQIPNLNGTAVRVEAIVARNEPDGRAARAAVAPAVGDQ